MGISISTPLSLCRMGPQARKFSFNEIKRIAWVYVKQDFVWYGKISAIIRFCLME